MIQKKVSKSAKIKIAAWAGVAVLSAFYPGRAVFIFIFFMMSFRGIGLFWNGIITAIILEVFLILGRMLSGSDALSFSSFLINAILGLLLGVGRSNVAERIESQPETPMRPSNGHSRELS